MDNGYVSKSWYFKKNLLLQWKPTAKHGGASNG